MRSSERRREHCILIARVNQKRSPFAFHQNRIALPHIERDDFVGLEQGATTTHAAATSAVSAATPTARARVGRGHMTHRPTNANAERTTTIHMSADMEETRRERAQAPPEGGQRLGQAIIAARIAFPAGAYKAVSPSPTRPPAMKTVNRGAAIIFAKGDHERHA